MLFSVSSLCKSELSFQRDYSQITADEIVLRSRQMKLFSDHDG